MKVSMVHDEVRKLRKRIEDLEKLCRGYFQNAAGRGAPAAPPTEQGEPSDTAVGDDVVVECLVPLYDRLAEATAQIPEASKARKGLNSSVELAEEALRRLGIIKYESHAETLMPNLQEAVSTENARDPSEDQKVAKVVRVGFRRERGRGPDSIVRPEGVVIRKWRGE